METSIVILSAGKGERMASALPKPIHPVGGKPILARILEAVKKAQLQHTWVVTKYAENLLQPIIRSFKAQSVTQSDKLGTAGALMSVPLEQLKTYTIVINGDHPLLTANDLKTFVQKMTESKADICVGTCSIADPKNYGRIVREGEQIVKIVESYDFDEETRAIQEVNTGLIGIRTQVLEKNLHLITNDNPKSEYPLTDLISIASQQGLEVRAIPVEIRVAFGVNTQEELSLANHFVFEQKTLALMQKGVIFPNPYQVHIEEDVQVAQGSIIYPGVYLKGRTYIGAYCAIEQNCFIFDSQIEHSVYIKSNSYIEKAHIKTKSVIGPFAHLRPGTTIGQECKVGNFVEMKNTTMGDQSKASHVCYLGDATIGKNVNIGCGTVTCNYATDKKKYKTTILDDSFIGSGSMLVAPLEVGEKSIVGAGSVITKNVPKQTLAVTRAKQVHKANQLAKDPSNQPNKK